MKKTMGILLSKNQYYLLKRYFGGKSKTNKYIDYLFDYRNYILFRNGITYYKRFSGSKKESVFEGNTDLSDRLAEQFRELDRKVDFSIIESDRLTIVGVVSSEQIVVFESNELKVTLNQNKYNRITDYDISISYNIPWRYFASFIFDCIAEYLYCY